MTDPAPTPHPPLTDAEREALPCPFCGSQPTLNFRRAYHENAMHSVACVMPLCAVVPETAWSATPEIAWDRWNSQSQIATLTAERDAAVIHRGLAAKQALKYLAERDTALASVAGLRGLLNNPHNNDWLEGVRVEAPHQQLRYAPEHDRGKTPWDWFWLIGYLAQKAAAAALADDYDKAMHHTISTGAVLLNWHRHLALASTPHPDSGESA